MVDLKSKFNTAVKLWLGALVVMSYVNFMVGCGEEEKSELQIYFGGANNLSDYRRDSPW